MKEWILGGRNPMRVQMQNKTKKKRKSLHSQKKRNTGLFEWHGEFKYKTVLERLLRNGPWRAEC